MRKFQGFKIVWRSVRSGMQFVRSFLVLQARPLALLDGLLCFINKCSYGLPNFTEKGQLIDMADD